MKKLLLLLCGVGIGIGAMLTEEEKQQKEVLIKWMWQAPAEEIKSIKETYAYLFEPDELGTDVCSNDNYIFETNETN
jgi:hypothetical protein